MKLAPVSDAYHWLDEYAGFDGSGFLNLVAARCEEGTKAESGEARDNPK